MPSSLFGPRSPQPRPSQTQPMNKGNLLQRFAQFKKEMAGKDPEKIVREMLADGRMSKEQFESLKTQVQSFMSILR